ncbi:hypothetical protein D3C71_1682550 [compost metagenome]
MKFGLPFNIPDVKVVKSNCIGSAHFKISLGRAGFVAFGTPGVINGLGVNAGSLKADVSAAVPPHVRENPKLLAGI